MFFLERQILYLKQLSHCPCNFMNISSEEFFSLGGIIFCCSVAKSYPTLCNPVNDSMPGFPILHYLPEPLKPMSIESAMPSNHLIPCRPLLLLPSISFQMSQLFAETHLCLDNLALGSHVLRPRDQGGSSRSRAGAVCLASGLTAST